jgi:hypothetical protein
MDQRAKKSLRLDEAKKFGVFLGPRLGMMLEMALATVFRIRSGKPAQLLAAWFRNDVTGPRGG